MLNFDHGYALGWNLGFRTHAVETVRHKNTLLHCNTAIAITPEVGLAAVVLYIQR